MLRRHGDSEVILPMTRFVGTREMSDYQSLPVEAHPVSRRPWEAPALSVLLFREAANTSGSFGDGAFPNSAPPPSDKKLGAGTDAQAFAEAPPDPPPPNPPPTKFESASDFRGPGFTLTS